MIRRVLQILIKIMQHKELINTAKDVWHMVDENFRITEKIEDKFKTKAEEFDKEMKKKYPELSSKEIEELRQTVAGEINAGKTPAVSNDAVITALKKESEDLKSENAVLKGQLAQVQEQLSKLQNIASTNSDQE